MAQDLLTGIGFLEPGQRNAEIVYNDAVLRIAVLSAKAVASLSSSLPATPTLPTLLILDGTNANKPNHLAYFWTNAQWFYVAPIKNMVYYNLATSAWIRFNGTAWVAL